MMNYFDFKLLHVNEITSTMALDEKMDEEKKKRLKIAFLFVIQYKKDNDVFALHSIVRFMLDDKVIYEGGVTMVIEHKGWMEMEHTLESLRKSLFAEQLIGYSLPFISGVQFVNTKETVLGGLLIPMINPKELVGNLKVEEI